MKNFYDEEFAWQYLLLFQSQHKQKPFQAVTSADA
jgi:hypothetical protein